MHIKSPMESYQWLVAPGWHLEQLQLEEAAAYKAIDVF